MRLVALVIFNGILFATMNGCMIAGGSYRTSLRCQIGKDNSLPMNWVG
jgi:hypothetical protein